MRKLLLPVLLLLLLGAPAVSDAAKVSRKKAIWGPVTVDGRSQFPIYKDLGVGIYQYAINWANVAPTRPLDPANPADPAYAWPAELDTAVREARRRGIQVSVLLIGAPPWANGGRPFNFAPTRARDFGTFAAAAARRYPGVRHWMIWGEPTKASNFQPIGKRSGPRKYAQILDAAYGALKRVSRRNRVIGGNTFTVGSIYPVPFLKRLRLPGGKRPRMDLWGHNPFTARKPNLKAPPLGGGRIDFSDLDNFARRLDRAYPRKRLKLFLSELTIPTDHENFEFNFYTSRKTQAAWIKAALRITRRYKRIYTFGYLGLYDDPVRADGRQVERGLLTRSGKRKPAYRAYKRG